MRAVQRVRPRGCASHRTQRGAIRARRPHQRGVGLIETMVGILIGLLVYGRVAIDTVTSNGRLMANTWQGAFPYRNDGAQGWVGTATRSAQAAAVSWFMLFAAPLALLAWLLPALQAAGRPALLRQLGWSPQRPLVRASQRNETGIHDWVTNKWPELKKEP